MTLRAGVWGTGAWGEKHARVYGALAREGAAVTLAGVFDRDPARAAAVAAEHGGRAFGSAEALLDACDVVSVAVPTVDHRAAAEQALAAGVHVLVEKPMAVTVAEADAMIAAAARSGRVLEVGQVERFNPALLAARSHVRDPKFIEGHRLALFQPRSLDIDVVFDLMIHDIDAVLQVAGTAPDHVSAVGVAVLSANEDIANARLEWADGCVANLTASRVSQERLRRLRFFQSDAYLSVDLFERTADLVRVDVAALRRLAGDGARAAAAALPAGPIAAMPGVRLEIEAFLRGIGGGAVGAAPAWAGREALRIAAAVRDAMKLRARQWSVGSA